MPEELIRSIMQHTNKKTGKPYTREEAEGVYKRHLNRIEGRKAQMRGMKGIQRFK